MSSSPSASAAETTALYQGLMMNNGVGFAVMTLLLADVFLCLDKEVIYVWNTSQTCRRVSRILYLYNRYMPLLLNIVANIAAFPLSDASCTVTAWLSQVLLVLSLIGPAVFTTLRVFALSKGNKMVSGVTLLLSLGPFLVNAVTSYQLVVTNLPPPLNCGASLADTESAAIGLTIASRASLVLADMLAVIITWRRTRTAERISADVLQRPSLEHILWENGILYFCTVVSLNILNIVLTVLSIATPFGNSDNGGSYIAEFVDPISAILTCRFLLALYETNTIIERGGSSVSSMSINFGRAGRDPGSPELPEFAQSLAGPIRYFPNGDPELFSIEGEQESKGGAEETGMEMEVVRVEVETPEARAEVQAEASSSRQVVRPIRRA